MFAYKRNFFSPFCVVLPILILCGCGPLVGGKAFTYREPVTDPDIIVDIYLPEKALQGTTLFSDNHNLEKPRIVEVNMRGEIVWQYLVPENLKHYTNPGFDAELLPNNNILFVLPRSGVYEIDRKGNVNWSYTDDKVSHDADRLPNGNTLVVWGGGDQISDAQVKEINPKGKIVWSWYAKDHFNMSPYKDISWEGWTHANAVTRLKNGNTLVSLRNFCFVAEVNPQGSVVRKIGEGVFYSQHDPEELSNANILVANQNIPNGRLTGYPNEMAITIRQKQPRWHQALEIDPNTGNIIWQSQKFGLEDMPVRDADRLPNGNTLITTPTRLIEVTAEGEIVWELKIKGIKNIPMEKVFKGLYKAQRNARP